MLRRIASSSWFALADLTLVGLGSLVWMFKPEVGIWPAITIALTPWVVRVAAGFPPFKSTTFDWLIVIFLATAWVGYWAAYDREAAWSKVWLIVLGVLLYYALAAQTAESLVWICALLFCIGVGVSLYFFVTHDFVAMPRKVEFVNRVGRWVMTLIPRPGWPPIPPNYVAGIAAITTPFILHPALKVAKRATFFSAFICLIIVAGAGLSTLAILMATSRGIIMAIASAIGIWILWQIVKLNGSGPGVRREAVFPLLVLIYLCAVVLYLYAGPATSSNASSEGYAYGTGTRGELFARSLYLLLDFPFTGGGLNAFPGLYSYYMLGIPNFYLPNSHNLFLDVAIEQGFLGLSFLIIFLMSVWITAQGLAKADAQHNNLFGWLTFFALIVAFVHGMVDDYLYYGNGAILSLALPGLSATMQPQREPLAQRVNYRLAISIALVLIVFFLLNANKLRAAWYANIGAVQMAKVELAGFPTNQWTEPSILPSLEQTDALFHAAVRADPWNRTENHRLGLIALLRRDFR